ncbi:MAG: DUF2959 domain-containing protein [Candidatus Kuenenia sp.]|nr:DUF2959 domain-containing protein [Candidatus Kuenenia hertensis]
MKALRAGSICSFSFMLFLLLNFSGCQTTTYYKTMERFGYHKREMLANRVKDARNILEETEEQFKSVLVEIRSVTTPGDSTYEEKYNKLNKEYEKSREKSLLITKRINSVETVAEALFIEWDAELEQYVSNSLRQSSRDKLNQKINQYQHLINSMKYVERKMDPVLVSFGDQVLYLKHNLNTQAIVSRQKELVMFEDEVISLIREIQNSIGVADTFINSIVE